MSSVHHACAERFTKMRVEWATRFFPLLYLINLWLVLITFWQRSHIADVFFWEFRCFCHFYTLWNWTRKREMWLVKIKICLFSSLDLTVSFAYCKCCNKCVFIYIIFSFKSFKRLLHSRKVWCSCGVVRMHLHWYRHAYIKNESCFLQRSNFHLDILSCRK